MSVAALHDRGAGRGRRPGPAFDGAGRQIGIADPDLDLVERQAEHLGADLRENGIGAGADIGCRRADQKSSLGREFDLGAGRHAQGFPDPARHTVADELAPLPHRARLRIALRPAECLGAAIVAILQRLAGERLVDVLLEVGIVLEPKLERIDAERIAKLVHRAFERIDTRRGSGRAHIHRAWPDRAARACD